MDYQKWKENLEKKVNEREDLKCYDPVVSEMAFESSDLIQFTIKFKLDVEEKVYIEVLFRKRKDSILFYTNHMFKKYNEYDIGKVFFEAENEKEEKILEPVPMLLEESRNIFKEAMLQDPTYKLKSLFEEILD